MSNTNLIRLHVRLNYKLFPLKVVTDHCYVIVGNNLPELSPQAQPPSKSRDFLW